MDYTKSDNKSHQESEMTVDFVNWYKINYGYVELFDDVDTTGGDPFDSAGLLGDKLVFIEFKVSINPGQVTYAGSRGSTIEFKISNLLRDVYINQTGKIYESVKNELQNHAVPVLILVVKSISKSAIRALKEMLERTSSNWKFNYQVIIWSDSKGSVCLENMSMIESDSMIVRKIEKHKSTAPKRGAKLTLDEVSAHMELEGLSAKFEKLCEVLKTNGAKFVFNQQNMNIKFPSYSNRAMMGIWPRYSTKERGISLSYDFSALNLYCNEGLDDVDSFIFKRNQSRKIGFLGNNTFIKSDETIRQLSEVLSSSKSS